VAVLPDPKDIDAVICDAGGVLLLPDFAAGREALRAVGCDPKEEDGARAHFATMLALDAMATPAWDAYARSLQPRWGFASGPPRAIPRSRERQYLPSRFCRRWPTVFLTNDVGSLAITMAERARKCSPVTSSLGVARFRGRVEKVRAEQVICPGPRMLGWFTRVDPVSAVATGGTGETGS
jgi:hypothetical protein